MVLGVDITPGTGPTWGNGDAGGFHQPPFLARLTVNPMAPRHAETTASTDALLIALADSQRRAVVRYFQDSPRDWASVAELSDAIRPASNTLTDEVTVRLHHSTLPRLEAAGFLDYDPQTKAIAYRGHDGVEPLLDALDEL